VGVVDPGVGTSRKPIVLATKRGTFVGPDNGLLTLAAKEAGIKAAYIPAGGFAASATPSASFHGRDIFAPLAARLACGLPAEACGRKAAEFTKLEQPKLARRGRTIRGEVIWADRFGNLVTNIASCDIERLLAKTAKGRGRRKSGDFATPPLSVTIGGRIVKGLKQTYGEARPGEVFALINSAGLLEIAAREESAKKLLGEGPGAAVLLSA
jgi:hypothetical protein